MPQADPTQPLVSCILPTFNRRGFLPHALHYFLRQDYPNAELLVVDDGTDPVGDLIPTDSRIQYIRLPRKITLGAKLNMCCEQVRGSIIAQWDDDDWYAPSRLSRQVEVLQRADVQVCGISDLLYYDVRTGRGYRYNYPRAERPWLLGSSLCFKRELWEKTRFADIDVGMDGLFVWATEPRFVHAMSEARFAVHLIHSSNISPKSPSGTWWQDYPVDDIAALMGLDWPLYESRGEGLTCPRPRTADNVFTISAPSAETNAGNPARNVYACLVHESPECVADLVRNLRCLDPDSTILLYNGGPDGSLFANQGALEQNGAVVYPAPRPMRWGSLHQFAVDCMRFALSELTFDTLTIVDSDQLGLRHGWSARLEEHLAPMGDSVGLLGNLPERLTRNTSVAAAITAWQEFDLWRPFLQRFPDGENKFVHWTFWPGTVFTAKAAKELVHLFDHDTQLQEIMGRSHLWVTEEIVFPTLTALLGFQVVHSPGSYDYVRFRVPYGLADVSAALNRNDAYWIHPIPREFNDFRRGAIRSHFNQYETGPVLVRSSAQRPTSACAEPRLSVLPMLAPGSRIPYQVRQSVLHQMRQVRGWLGDAEADLLMTATDEALAACPDANAVVEVGSYCGRGTTVLAGVVRTLRPTARVWAMDPHDGLVGALDVGLHQEPPTLEIFRQTIQRAGLSNFVETIQAKAPSVTWSDAICLLVIDGLHDYGSVSADFLHFESFLADSALVAFHDYADYFPGVRKFVDELLVTGRYKTLTRAEAIDACGGGS
jgi:hypothetical protein